MLPILGTMALAAQKLLPALQQTYYFWASLAKYHADIRNILEAVSMPTTKRLKTKDQGISFKNNIKFQNIWFRYNKEGEYILKDVNFEIHQGESVGIMGQSGCGKSTFDILMGLLEHSKGSNMDRQHRHKLRQKPSSRWMEETNSPRSTGYFLNRRDIRREYSFWGT